MKTYENYYGITLQSDSARYEVIKKSNIDEMLRFIAQVSSDEDLNTVDTRKSAENYLIANGMSNEEVKLLYNKICMGDY